MNSIASIWRIAADEAGPCPAEIKTQLVAGIPAALPGAVHQALLAAGLIPDPFFADNAKHLDWIEQLHWILEVELEGVASMENQPVELVLDGVDTYASIFLNDELVGTTNNAFLRYAFPVSKSAKTGGNHLRLEFQTLAEAVGPSPKIYPCAFMHPLRAHVRRMQCTFGWDWVPPFLTFGLSSVPQLVSVPQILFPAILVEKMNPESAQLQARWEIATLADSAALDLEIAIHSPAGKLLTKQTFPTNKGVAEFEVADPEKWYPVGYGSQPLYQATFTLIREGKAIGESITLPFGIRETELLIAFDAPGSLNAELTGEFAHFLKHTPEEGREFGFRVNGVDVFALGGNWVPCDPFPGPEAEARKKEILRRFVKSGGNTIRIWGGGIYESTGFYDTCAELGILVLQDFMMACSDYPAEDPSFMEKLAPEIDQAVRRLRAHTSIIHWYGDNENAMQDGEHSPGKAWFEIAEKLIRPALARHDLGRSFTPSCPFFGTPSTNPLQGDSHISVAFTEDRGFLLSDTRHYKQQFDGTVGRFVSEHALFGAPDIESLLRFMPEDRLDDADLWEFHTRDNPSRPPGVDITLFQSLELMASKILGPFENSQDRLRKLAYVHHEAVRLAVEAARRKQPFCRGLLFWMLNDCWPASGWSHIDYYGRPKAAYYGFKHAAQAVHPSFRSCDDRVEVWLSNNSAKAIDRTVTLSFETWEGAKTILESAEISVPFGASQKVFDLDKSGIADATAGVFVAQSGTGESGWHFDGMPFEMKVPPVTLEVALLSQDADSLTCRVSAPSYARVVTLRGVALADENYFDLRAGEAKIVRLELPQGSEKPELSFEAWNGASTRVPMK